MVSPLAGLVAVPLIWLHARGRRPTVCAALAVTADGRFALPDEGRFDLALAPASRSGPGWLILVFADRPGHRMLLLRDQLDAPAWRALRLAVRERP
jgi:hypothetical protein